MPEPLSQVLRRLHEEATLPCDGETVCPPGVPECVTCMRNEESERAIRHALPALADLVEATESEHALRHGVPGGQKDVGQCFHQCCRALAALRERLAVKP